MIRRTKNKTLKFAKDELKKLLVFDYRLLAERFRSDQFTSKQMTEEFKTNPEFKDWYFKNYWALEKWRSIWKIAPQENNKLY